MWIEFPHSKWLADFSLSFLFRLQKMLHFMVICWICGIIFYVMESSHLLSWDIHFVLFKNCICLLLNHKNKCTCLSEFTDADRFQKHGMDEFISANPCKLDHAFLFRILQRQTLDHRLNDSYSCLVSTNLSISSPIG